MASSNHSLNSVCHGISSNSKHDLASNPLQHQLSLPDTELIAAEVIADAHNDDSSELYDVIADIKLPHELELQLNQLQKKEGSLDCDAVHAEEHSYVGVEKVPGRTRYGLVPTYPVCLIRKQCADGACACRGDVVRHNLGGDGVQHKLGPLKTLSNLQVGIALTGLSWCPTPAPPHA